MCVQVKQRVLTEADDNKSVYSFIYPAIHNTSCLFCKLDQRNTWVDPLVSTFGYAQFSRVLIKARLRTQTRHKKKQTNIKITTKRRASAVVGLSIHMETFFKVCRFFVIYDLTAVRETLAR